MINKEEIVQRVSFALEDVNKEITKDVIDTLFEIMTDVLKKGEDIRFTNFGTFKTKIRKGRIGVNPRNPSEKIEISDVRVVKFVPSSSLKKTVKNHEL